MAIARILLDKFHPMKHIEHPFEHPLCWCGVRHFEMGEKIFIDHRGFSKTVGVKNASEIAKTTANDGNRGARTGKVEQGE